MFLFLLALGLMFEVRIAYYWFTLWIISFIQRISDKCKTHPKRATTAIAPYGSKQYLPVPF